MKCAACRQEQDLCQSCKIDGVKQPRICKDCLLKEMRGDAVEIDDETWIQQLIEQAEVKSLEILAKGH